MRSCLAEYFHAKAAAFDHGSGKLAIVSSDDVNDAEIVRLEAKCSVNEIQELIKDCSNGEA